MRVVLIIAIIFPSMIICHSRGEQFKGETSNNRYKRGLSHFQQRPNQEYYQQQPQVQSYNSPIYNEPNTYNSQQQYPSASPLNTYNSRPAFANQPPPHPPQPPSNPIYYQQSVPYGQSQTQSQQSYQPIYNRPSSNAPLDASIARPPQTLNYNYPQSQQNNPSSVNTVNSRLGADEATTEVFATRPTRKQQRPLTPTSRPPDFDNRFDDRDSIKKKLVFDKDLSNSMETFGLELLQQFNARYPQDNFMISPFSIYHLLVLIAEGAQGSTYNELSSALKLGSLERTRDFQQYLNVALG